MRPCFFDLIPGTLVVTFRNQNEVPLITFYRLNIIEKENDPLSGRELRVYLVVVCKLILD
jgi:hypothetical protein